MAAKQLCRRGPGNMSGQEVKYEPGGCPWDKKVQQYPGLC